MNKKLTGAAAAIVGSLLYGAAELMNIQSRLDALEAIVLESQHAEEDKEVEELDAEEGLEEPLEKPQDLEPDNVPDALSQEEPEALQED